jgi:hypothetical protein
VIGPRVAAEEYERWTGRRVAPGFDRSRDFDAGLELGHMQAVLLGTSEGLVQCQTQGTFLRRDGTGERRRERDPNGKMPCLVTATH